ncbi:piggyBac transposable element-derived protein 4-like [Erpetoichthys calabaricus]|uniref:PiggyBac transposable element-derived protein 4-like n=1 Tax=Erpetoichthys calabaricus TaxID=27687 RepID=A0A8C4RND1_ERPCA|nr:piggyBac transposable element-derived protein 4-like [Erpetoichthys calabaricus]
MYQAVQEPLVKEYKSEEGSSRDWSNVEERENSTLNMFGIKDKSTGIKEEGCEWGAFRFKEDSQQMYECNGMQNLGSVISMKTEDLKSESVSQDLSPNEEVTGLASTLSRPGFLQDQSLHVKIEPLIRDMIEMASSSRPPAEDPPLLPQAALLNTGTQLEQQHNAFRTTLRDKDMTASHPNHSSKMNAKKALEMLQNMDYADSDGGPDIDFELDSDASSDSESESDLECASEPAPEADAVTSQPPRHKRARMETLEPVSISSGRKEKARDGTVWTLQVVGEESRVRRRPAHYVFTDTAGPTKHAKERISSRLDSFLCLCDVKMLTHIRDCTVAEAQKTDTAWDLTVDELMAFIALSYLRGVYGGKNMDMESYWSEKFGITFFKETMSRNRYRQIMKFLRFDNRETRQERLRNDKFAAISDTWHNFVQNCIKCYKPGQNITIDEQFFPTKCRCPFTQFMSSKPDKFGIKFWMATDLSSKYMLNAIPYLGRDGTRKPGERPSETVALRLVEPFIGKGRNVTVASRFTSLSLANKLLAKKMSLLGSMNKKRQEVPPSIKGNTPREPFLTTVMATGKATLTVYTYKPKKCVCVLSTMHAAVRISSDRKKKPDTLMDYNRTKVGVDVLDQMAKLYTVKGGSHRWPVAVFYNLLDLAAINAHILYEQCMGKREGRRQFIMDLAWELREKHMAAKEAAASTEKAARIAATLLVPLPPGKTTQCQVRRCKRNKAKENCVKCRRFVCGSCSRKAPRICADC